MTDEYNTVSNQEHDIEFENIIKAIIKRDNYSITWAKLLEELEVSVGIGLISRTDYESIDITELLFIACESNDIDLSRWAVTNGAEIHACNLQSKNSPLHIAASKGNLECVEFLVECGVSVDSVNNDENTPLHLATQNNHPKCVEYLLMKNHHSVSYKNHQGELALHLAAKNGYRECMSYILYIIFELRLVERIHVNINHPSITGDRPLHLVAKHGHLDCLELLANVGGVDFAMVDKNKKTALHLAVENLHYECVEFLAKEMHESAINQKDEQGMTALHLALFSNIHLCYNGEAVIKLLFNKADNSNIVAACDYAKERGDIRIRKIFLDCLSKFEKKVQVNLNQIQKYERYSNLTMVYVATGLPIFDLIIKKEEENNSAIIIDIIKIIFALIPAFASIINGVANTKLNVLNTTLTTYRKSIVEITESIEARASYKINQEADDVELHNLRLRSHHDSTLEVLPTQQKQNIYMLSKSELQVCKPKRIFNFSSTSNISRTKLIASPVPSSSTKPFELSKDKSKSLATILNQVTIPIEEYYNLGARPKIFTQQSSKNLSKRPKQHVQQGRSLSDESIPSILIQGAGVIAFSKANSKEVYI